MALKITAGTKNRKNKIKFREKRAVSGCVSAKEC